MADPYEIKKGTKLKTTKIKTVTVTKKNAKKTPFLKIYIPKFYS